MARTALVGFEPFSDGSLRFQSEVKQWSREGTGRCEGMTTRLMLVMTMGEGLVTVGLAFGPGTRVLCSWAQSTRITLHHPELWIKPEFVHTGILFFLQTTSGEIDKLS